MTVEGMDREDKMSRRTPFADVTNVARGNKRIEEPHGNGRTTTPMKEEQKKEVMRTRDRARYAKKHPFAKRSRKDDVLLLPPIFGIPGGNQGVGTPIQSTITRHSFTQVGLDVPSNRQVVMPCTSSARVLSSSTRGRNN